jgi:uroporphyrinogen-III decarboxylase
MDVISLRKKYGKNLRMIGNIDKKALLAGPEAITKEVESKVRDLVNEGGYIPGIDHEVPEDVSFSNYCFYVNLLKRTCSKL